MDELVEAIQNKDYFKRPPLMKLNGVQDQSRDYVYHHGHDNEECCHLDEHIKVEKLKEFIWRKDKEAIENDNEYVPVHTMHIAVVVPSIFEGNDEFSKKTKRLHSGEVNLVVMARALPSSIVPISFSKKEALDE